MNEPEQPAVARTWHADRPMMIAYGAGRLSPARAGSVESHLATCGPCRSVLASVADASRLASNWAVIEDRLDEGDQPLIERLLVRIGLREHHAQLTRMAPSLRGSTFGAAAVLSALVLLSLSGDGPGDGQLYVFLVVAPLLPLAGVAAAFGGLKDPARELARVAPTPAFELLLARVVAVVATTTILSVVAALPLPHRGWAVATWLLPAFGLSAASLALSTWVPAHWAAAGLGTAWVAAAVVSWRVNRFDADAVGRFAALRPAGQMLFAAVAACGALVLVLRRETLEYRRIP